MTDSERLLTVAEVASTLRLDKRTIYNHINNGRLKAKDVATGARPIWRIRQAWLNEFLGSDQPAAETDSQSDLAEQFGIEAIV